FAWSANPGLLRNWGQQSKTRRPWRGPKRKRPRKRGLDHRAKTGSELVAQARLEGVEGGIDTGMAIQFGQDVIARIVEASEIDIKILGLQGDVRRHAIFDARARSPAPPGVRNRETIVRLIGLVDRCVDVAIGRA